MWEIRAAFPCRMLSFLVKVRESVVVSSVLHNSKSKITSRTKSAPIRKSFVKRRGNFGRWLNKQIFWTLSDQLEAYNWCKGQHYIHVPSLWWAAVCSSTKLLSKPVVSRANPCLCVIGQSAKAMTHMHTQLGIHRTHATDCLAVKKQ